MKTDIPKHAQKHIDLYDMIGMFKSTGNDENGNPIGSLGWVDGGDSCHFTGIYHYCYALSSSARASKYYYGNMLGRLTAAEANLQCRSFFGGYKRHPDNAYWYSDNDRMSRDQATPMLSALAISNSKKQLTRQLLHYAKRGFLFATNTRRNGTTAKNHKVEYAPGRTYNYNWKIPDPMLFDIWSIHIRGLNLWILYPLLLLADLQTYVNARRILSDNTDTDVANFFIKHSLSRKRLPTFIGAFTDKLLARLNLEARIAKRYSASGMPTFLGEILQKAMSQFTKEIK